MKITLSIEKNIDEFCEKYKNEIDWVELCKHHELKEPFIRKFKDYVDWVRISEFHSNNVSEEFLIEFKDYFDWAEVCYCRNMSEELMEKCADYLDWDRVAVEQTLSESFIRKYIEKFNCSWYNITRCQKLSETFVSEFVPDVCLKDVFENDDSFLNFSVGFLMRHSKYIDKYKLIYLKDYLSEEDYRLLKAVCEIKT